METKNLNLTPEGDGANKEKGAKSGSKFEKVAKAATVVGAVGVGAVGAMGAEALMGTAEPTDEDVAMSGDDNVEEVVEEVIESQPAVEHPHVDVNAIEIEEISDAGLAELEPIDDINVVGEEIIEPIAEEPITEIDPDGPTIPMTAGGEDILVVDVPDPDVYPGEIDPGEIYIADDPDSGLADNYGSDLPDNDIMDDIIA